MVTHRPRVVEQHLGRRGRVLRLGIDRRDNVRRARGGSDDGGRVPPALPCAPRRARTTRALLAALRRTIRLEVSVPLSQQNIGFSLLSSQTGPLIPPHTSDSCVQHTQWCPVLSASCRAVRVNPHQASCSGGAGPRATCACLRTSPARPVLSPSFTDLIPPYSPPYKKTTA